MITARITLDLIIINSLHERKKKPATEDSRVEIYCNASDQKINCTIREHQKSSYMAQLARQLKPNPNRLMAVSDGFVLVVRLWMKAYYPK